MIAAAARGGSLEAVVSIPDSAERGRRVCGDWAPTAGASSPSQRPEDEGYFGGGSL